VNSQQSPSHLRAPLIYEPLPSLLSALRLSDNREQATMMAFVQCLVTGSGYLANERQLLGISRASYDDQDLLRNVLQMEKERRKKLPWFQKFRDQTGRTLLSYACEHEDTGRIQLLFSLGASTCIYCIPKAVELGRFEIAQLILEYDPTAAERMVSSKCCPEPIGFLNKSRENVLKFAGLPGVTASDKVDLGLA
jgi:hypothetical protein